MIQAEPIIHSDSFNNAEQFIIDVSFNTFYSTEKNILTVISQNDRWIFIMPVDFYRLT